MTEYVMRREHTGWWAVPTLLGCWVRELRSIDGLRRAAGCGNGIRWPAMPNRGDVVSGIGAALFLDAGRLLALVRLARGALPSFVAAALGTCWGL